MYATTATFTMSCNAANCSSCESKLNGTVGCLPPLETCMVPHDNLKSNSHGVKLSSLPELRGLWAMYLMYMKSSAVGLNFQL